jgi:hypothetical protein
MRRAAHGYEPTRKAAMAAFAKRWRASSMIEVARLRNTETEGRAVAIKKGRQRGSVGS